MNLEKKRNGSPILHYRLPQMLLTIRSDLPLHHQEEEQQFLLLAYRNTFLLQSAFDRSRNDPEFKEAHLVKDSMNNEQV